MNSISCLELARDTSQQLETDHDLVIRIQQGDQQALGLLYDRHSGLVYSIARRILNDPSEAEDVLQDIFLQIWHLPLTFVVAEEGLRRWLAVVTRNHSIHILRKKTPWVSTDDLVLISNFNLARHCEVNLVSERAKQLILDLPPEQQKLLNMSFFQGMTHSEIAEHVGYPMGTVKSRIRHALACLRKSLEQNQESPA